jgi:hypothetical protein
VNLWVDFTKLTNPLHFLKPPFTYREYDKGRKGKTNNMLHTSNKHTEHSTRWERIQQPVHGTDSPSDYLRLLAALDEGWQIVEVAYLLAHGSNAEGRGYLLTLMHSHRLLTREWNVMRSPEVDALLAFEGVPGFHG